MHLGLARPRTLRRSSASTLSRYRRAGVRRRGGAGLGAAPRGRPRYRNQPAADVRRALPLPRLASAPHAPRLRDAPACAGSLLSPGEEAFQQQQSDEAETKGLFGKGKGNQRNMRK